MHRQGGPQQQQQPPGAPLTGLQIGVVNQPQSNRRNRVLFFTQGDQNSVTTLNNFFTNPPRSYTNQHPGGPDLNATQHVFRRNITPQAGAPAAGPAHVDITVSADTIQVSAGAEQQDFNNILDLLKQRSEADGLRADETEIIATFANAQDQATFFAALTAKRADPRQATYWNNIRVVDSNRQPILPPGGNPPGGNPPGGNPPGGNPPGGNPPGGNPPGGNPPGGNPPGGNPPGGNPPGGNPPAASSSGPSTGMFGGGSGSQPPAAPAAGAAGTPSTVPGMKKSGP